MKQSDIERESKDWAKDFFEDPDTPNDLIELQEASGAIGYSIGIMRGIEIGFEAGRQGAVQCEAFGEEYVAFDYENLADFIASLKEEK